MSAGLIIQTIAQPLINTAMDQLFAAITPNKVTEGNQRLASIQGVVVTEGEPMNVVYGTQRVGGFVLAVGDLLEVKDPQNYGGKGYSPNANTVIYYTYFVNIAVGICQAPAAGITKVSRIWANNRLIYVDLATQNASSNTIGVAAQPTINTIFLGMELYAPDPIANPGVPDLRRFAPGYPITVSGFANSLNNGTFMVAATGRDIDGRTFCRIENLVGVVATAGPTINLSQTASGFVNITVGNNSAIPNGNYSQAINPLMQSIHEVRGAPATPAYRGIAYCIFELLGLADFNDSLPTFQFEVVSSINSLAGVVQDVLGLSAIQPSEYDTSGLSATVTGYTWKGGTTAKEILAPLLLAYDYIPTVVEDKLTFQYRGQDANPTLHYLPVIVVDPNDLSAREFGGEELVRGIEFHDVADFNLPRTIQAQFIEPVSDYQIYSRMARREFPYIGGGCIGLQRLDLPLVLTAGAAGALADRELYRLWKNRQAITVVLPPKYTATRVGAVLSLLYEGIQYYLIVTKVERGYNHLVKITGVND